jgi:uncharacterized membrane protein
MLSPEENRFIEYWQKNRARQKRTIKQLLIGLPFGMLLAIPISINFFSGWYRRAVMVRNSEEFNPIVLLIALLLIVGFVAIFSQKHKWDMREQKYLELLDKKKQEESSGNF